MNNSVSINHAEQLKTRAKIIADCKEAKAFGIKVKDWLESHNISHDTYYYWYAEVKAACIDNSLPEIVPIKNELISETRSVASIPFDKASDAYVPSSTSCIKLSVNGITIEVNELINPELLTNVIKAVRYA